MYGFHPSHGLEAGLLSLTRTLSRDEDVLALYVFGSRATGLAGPLSDTDLAVLLREDIDFHDKRLGLLALSCQVLRTDRVDLVVLNVVPHALAYRVFRDGRLLYERAGASRDRIRFEANTYIRYLDFLPVHHRVHGAMRQRLKEGRFGARS